MFFGRFNESETLNNLYKSSKSELLVMYGRRRIGKSTLVKNFMENKPFYSFEAIESQNTLEQIDHFVDQLKTQFDDSLISQMKFESWHDVFNYLTEKIINRKRNNKIIIFFDELQWMATRKSTLISLLKFYWDTKWKDHNVMFILCGSIASFMIDKVVNSKALYGRITSEIHLKGLRIHEAAQFFQKKRSKEEILSYLLVFGTIPKYLEMIRLDRSFDQNIGELCFSKHAVMIQEVEKIFYSQFQKETNYLKIVNALKKNMLSLDEISKKIQMSSGGGLKKYIDNLVKADIVGLHIPWDRDINSKVRKYKISDEFLSFYFKFIEPNKKLIAQSTADNLFRTLTRDNFHIWSGFAFERFCLKHSSYMAELMGFGKEVAIVGSHFSKDDNQFQVDLIYKRFDKVITICEIKHSKDKITTKIIPEMERKKSLLSIPRGYSVETALISLYGPDQALSDSGYFTHSVTLEDMFK